MLPNAASVHLVLCAALCIGAPVAAQVPPSAAEIAGYRGLHAAAQRGDVEAIAREVARGAALDARDPHGRTPLHVATYLRQRLAIRVLAQAGASLDLLESDRYDAVTIASVADDPQTLALLLSLGAHDAMTRKLVAAGAR